MPLPKLIFNGTETELRSGRNSLGRSSDNHISFSGDSNVSRYHAEIEVVGDECWLIDLGSANGTTLNGRPVERRERLVTGDEIILGGSSSARFEGLGIPAPAEPEAAAASGTLPDLASAASTVSAPAPGASALPAGAAPSGVSGLLIAVGVVGVIAALVVVGAAAFYLTRPAACNAKVKIIAPESGDTLLEATDIDIDLTEIGCVGNAVYKIDGVEFATVDAPPFAASIDPKEFPDLADGFEHNLTIELTNLKGEPIGVGSSVMLAFDTREIEKPESNTQVAQQQTNTQPSGKASELSLIDVQEMSNRLASQFSGGFKYNVSNKDFLTEVRKRTGEYARDGYFDRASRYRDVINVAYVREQNVDAALGFLLAMSRSGFVAEKKGSDEGLWRMSSAFVNDNAYNGLCGSETLSDPLQNCAAKASALYMKAIVYGVFEGDPIYSAVAFGKSPQDAGAWKATLPANRTNVWTSIRTPQEREQLIQFFAAGIVAENPQKFGLRKDRPLSELYRLTM